jgi:hypothetical protein
LSVLNGLEAIKVAQIDKANTIGVVAIDLFLWDFLIVPFVLTATGLKKQNLIE